MPPPRAHRTGRCSVRAVVGFLATAMVLAACTGDPGEPGDPTLATTGAAVAPVLRVDQVGYATAGEKPAYAMGGDLDGAAFEVVDADGDVVLDGEVGDPRGAWNATYDDVRAIDLTGLDEPGLYELRLTGGGVGAGDVTAPVRVAEPDELLAPLVGTGVEFLGLQRDGADQVAPGRRPSHLLDAAATVYDDPVYDAAAVLTAPLTPVSDQDAVVDVAGGWFDAGDYLKFTGTTAYAVVALLVAARDAPGQDVATGEGDSLSAEAQHGLDWLARSWLDGPGVLLSQVGIGQGDDEVLTDHDVWRLPEDDDATAVDDPSDPTYLIGHRPVFRANEPGEPVPPSLAGRVAAAFALAAQAATADDDDEAARDWLERGAAVYAAADPDPDVSAGGNATAVPAAFYPEDSWADDLELAAVELARAADDLGDDRAGVWRDEAGRWAQAYVDGDALGSLEVADVSALAHAELVRSDHPLAGLALDDLRRQLDEGVARAQGDPFGVGVALTDFDSVPHALGLAATADLYGSVTGDDAYAGFAARQRSWVLGANPWGTTFVVGAGEVSPQCPEHQVANLTGRPATGAVVNGPNRAELLDELNGFPTMVPCSADGGEPYASYDGRGARYLDDVGAWQTVEPAIDFTANGVLVFALGAAGPG